MNRNIKLIWDFRGADAIFIAQHHQKHLQEYLLINPYKINTTGCEQINDYYALAYLVVEENDMLHFRDKLKPHRAEVYEIV